MSVRTDGIMAFKVSNTFIFIHRMVAQHISKQNNDKQEYDK